MLAPLLVTEDPYAAASVFSQAGWKFESGGSSKAVKPRACVSLALARVVLVTATSQRIDALPRGLGVELQLPVPTHELRRCTCCTGRGSGARITDLRRMHDGEACFSAEIIVFRL